MPGDGLAPKRVLSYFLPCVFGEAALDDMVASDAQLALGRQAVAVAEEILGPTAYASVDTVRSAAGQPASLELIDPSSSSRRTRAGSGRSPRRCSASWTATAGDLTRPGAPRAGASGRTASATSPPDYRLTFTTMLAFSVWPMSDTVRVPW
jgi:hypothetical protein